MTKKVRGMAVTLAVAFALAGPSKTTIAHELRGFVVDDDDRPIPEVTVALEGTAFVTVSDSVGGFVFEDVPAGTYAVSVRSTCTISGHVSGVRIPRPLRVPYPVVAHRLSCEPHSDVALDFADQAAIVTDAFWDAVLDERREITRALLADGAIEIAVVGAWADSLALGEGLVVPIVHLASAESELWGPPEGEPRIRICLASPDPETALVGIAASLPAELPLLRADRTLLLFRRAAGAWDAVHHLYCLDRLVESPGDEDAGSER